MIIYLERWILIMRNYILKKNKKELIMSDFKIKFKISLRPILKDRGWEVNSVKAGKKEKICGHCKNKIPIGQPAITFVKRITKADRTSYLTQHAHKGFCAMKIAESIEEFDGKRVIDISK